MSAHSVTYTYTTTETMEFDIDPFLDQAEKEEDAIAQIKEELLAVADEGSIKIVKIEVI